MTSTGSTHPIESHSTPGSPVRQRSLWLKAIGVGLIVFLLASCSALVFGVVTERHQRARTVEYEVTSTWGPRQIVGGPLLYVLESAAAPPSQTQGDSQSPGGPAPLTRITDRTATRQRLLPRQLDWQATAEPEIRRRGLYPVLLYRAKLHGSGFFAVPAAAGRARRVQGIELAFGSLEGIQTATITLDGATRPLERLPVDPQRSILWTDAEIPLPAEGEARVPFEVEVELHGSGRAGPRLASAARDCPRSTRSTTPASRRLGVPARSSAPLPKPRSRRPARCPTCRPTHSAPI
jgi:inner membrane protein involved in colicin E2 resistance